MKGYIVCVYKSINDQNALKDYAIKARAAVEKYNGKFLVRGGKKVTTEGEDWKRTVVIEFPSFEDAKTFFRMNYYRYFKYSIYEASKSSILKWKP